MTKKIFVLVLLVALALAGCTPRTVDRSQAKSTPVVAAITARPTPIVVQTKDRETPRASRSSFRPTPVLKPVVKHKPVKVPVRKAKIKHKRIYHPRVVRKVIVKSHVIPNKRYVPPGGAAACIRHWESGGNYRAINPSSGASGAYQFLDTTWHYITGLPGKAMNYPPAVQDAAFWKLWDGGKNANQWVTSYHCD